jgi:transcriptional regulator with XRE-family HTH domain
MKLMDEVTSILTPSEFRVLRKQMAGWTLEHLSKRSKISIAQLSEFENAKNGLRRDQVELCEKLLLRAAAEREQMISALFDRRNDATGKAAVAS